MVLQWRTEGARRRISATRSRAGTRPTRNASTAISAVMLISPSAYHRVTFRYQQKRKLIFYANQFSIAGLGFLALAMTGAITLVTDFLFGTAAKIITTVFAAMAFGFFWFGMPLQRRLSLSAGQEPLGKPEND